MGIKWWKLDMMNAVWCGDAGSTHWRNPILYVFCKKKKRKKNLKEIKNILAYGPLGRHTFIHTNEKSPNKSRAIKYICNSNLDGTNNFSNFSKLILHIPNKSLHECSGSVYF